MGNLQQDFDTNLEALKIRVGTPPKAKVVLYNDDYTPMEFVVEVLNDVFHMQNSEATNVVLKIHSNGWGICGEFTRDIAETKAAQVVDIARISGHPLFCQAKPA